MTVLHDHTEMKQAKAHQSTHSSCILHGGQPVLSEADKC